MAEIIISPLLQVVFEKLANRFLEAIANKLGLKKEVRKLQKTLDKILAVLADAEEQQLTNRALRIWLTELKEVANEIEDLLDEFSLDFQSRNQGGFAEQVRSFIPSLVQAAGGVDLLPRLMDIKETLEILADEMSSFDLKDRVNGRGSRIRGRRQTGSSIVESEVLGREEDKGRIIGQLLASNSYTAHQRDISVVSIVGLGGLGKTTLAQLVYNNETVTAHFDLKIWVCVGDDFDVGKIMKDIIESDGKNKCDIFGMNALQLRLQELLRGKRYLLVLDDVWNEDDMEWEKLRMPLRTDMEGSRIIVTTRSKKVALMMESTYIHELEGLSDDDCWVLFKQRAFGNGEEKQNLLPIGRQIVRKCGGVPLAAKTLGSLMRFKREEREWLVVKESDLWDVSQNDSGILPALRLSYSHLPSHLKACFAYCAIFPKSYTIKREKLIQLWIAAGLVRSPDGIRSLEFVGNEYFDDLVWMFFFQDIQKSESGYITDYKMHDLIHDLAVSIVGNEFKILEHDSMMEDLSGVRHSTVVCNFSSTVPEALYTAAKLRSLILLIPKGDLGEVPQRIFSTFRHLRALDLSSSGIKRLHDSISSTILLRYLDISSTHIENLPESICSLRNLKYLNLSGCYNLIELPRGITNLTSLRHLIISGCKRLTTMPPLIGNLTCLRTLSMFIVGENVVQNLKQLKDLNLGGELKIKQLQNVKDSTEAKEADLVGKRNLQSLHLCWGSDFNGLNENSGNNGLLQGVLDHLQPHGYLKKLTIRRYQGIHLPRWMSVDKLPKITELRLINCRKCEYLPALGQLPYLRSLYLKGMDAVKNIGMEFYGDSTGTLFPSLKELTVIDFPSLQFWMSFNRKEVFPSLVKLTLSKCSRLQNMPCFPSLNHLELHSLNEMVLQSASTLTTLNILVIEKFGEQLVLLENLLKQNALLTSLKISSCPKLHSVPPSLGKLVNLKSLAISWCEELHSFPSGLQNLTSLESLEIIECHSLVSLPEDIQGLHSLRSLSIENCSKLTSLPVELQFLTALERLTIMYCQNLVSLPDSFQHLSNLKCLSVLNCPELKCLPEGLKYVTSMQNIEIRSCPGLMALPEWIAELTSLRSLALSDCHNLTSLPSGLQSLVSLQHLSILECPNLEQRCKKDGGEDWPKISHVAHVYIGSRETESSSSY